MVDGRQIRVRGRLNDLEEALDGQAFFRCHHSFLIDLSFVNEIDSATMTASLYGGKRALIRRGWLVRTRSAWENRLFELTRAKHGDTPKLASSSR